MENKSLSLRIAEAIDAWRIAPRLMVACYGFLVYKVYEWYTGLSTYVKSACDSGVIKVLLDSGMDISKAEEYACTVVDVVGGPTAAQSAFASTIVGLSTAIFAFYTSTGRKWKDAS